MHPALTFGAAACLVIAVLLLFSAFQGASYYGVTPQAQLALAIMTLVVAAIVIWIIYKAAKAKLSKIKTGKEALIGLVGARAKMIEAARNYETSHEGLRRRWMNILYELGQQL